jgi:tol-pal system protein YbgF
MKTSLSIKQFFKLLSFILFSMIVFSSCISDKEFGYLNDQIVALNKRITGLKESQKSTDTKLGSDLDSRLKSLHSGQAEFGVELDQMKKAIEELSGRIEDNEHIIKRTVERDLTDQDAMEATLAELSQKVTELEGMVKQQHQYLGLERPGIREGQAQKKGLNEQGETPLKRPVVVKKPKSKELELYDNSLDSFKEGEFQQAMERFKNFLKTYPRSDRADNAQFWIGESYMALKRYEQAILAYQEVIKKYPKGNKTPNAMLRQAMAFLEIKDKTSFRLLLKKIVSKYPKSTEARIARKKLKGLR